MAERHLLDAEGVHPVAAVQIVVAPMHVRALYSEDVVEDEYCAAIADLAWHALARKSPG